MATARMPQPTADDPMKIDPKHYKVEFENDRVRVVRIKYKPGEKSVMHSHPESIGYAHAKFTYPTERVRTSKRRLGRCCTWMPLLTCRKTPARNHSRSSKYPS